jgi:hypothetical protein
MVGVIGHDNRCAADQPERNNNPESDILHAAPPSVTGPVGARPGRRMKEAAI